MCGPYGRCRSASVHTVGNSIPCHRLALRAFLATAVCIRMNGSEFFYSCRRGPVREAASRCRFNHRVRLSL